MAQALHARGNHFELHYSARTAADMAYRDRLAVEFSDRLHLYFTQTPRGSRIDLVAVMGAAPTDALIYICGPAGLIEAAKAAARALFISAKRLQYERFE
jgi:ferredoxin-NADP reductase